MLKGTHYVFAIVVNFISSDWEAKHVTIGLFKVMGTSGATMVPKLQELLDKFSLTKKNIAYIKDEMSNLQPFTNALTCIISYNNLALLEPFNGSCLGHAISKVCQ